MSQFKVIPAKFAQLKGKVVVLTGGASGIGAATTSRLYSAGAHVFMGDIDQANGNKVVEQLIASSPAVVSSSADPAPITEASGSATFVPCDASVYEDIYKLFRAAYDRHGRVDHAIANAGLIERGSWFDVELTVDSVGTKQETTQVLDVNVYGTAVFARIAAVFLRETVRSRTAQPGSTAAATEEPSLVILGSVASIRESPGMPLYQASKHAALGLMRSLRRTLYERDHVRVNCVCPGFTESAMTEKIFHIFQEKGLATQTSDDVAQIILGVLVANGLNGKSIYVEAAKGWEYEDGFWGKMDQWLGEEPTRQLKKNAEFISSVSDRFSVQGSDQKPY